MAFTTLTSSLYYFDYVFVILVACWALVINPTAGFTRRPLNDQLDTLIVHMINRRHYQSQQVTSEPVDRSQHTPNLSNWLGSLSSSSSSSSSGNSQANSQQQPSKNYSCPLGSGTYWDARHSRCTNCTATCPDGATVSKQCNQTHDLQCLCPKGQYIKDHTCKPCLECPAGYGVWRTCRWSRNTVCRKCQPGTYSGVSVGTLGCIPCSQCGPSQEMISECDGNRDTVCLDRSTLANYSHLLGSRYRSMSIPAAETPSPGLPFYFILILVIAFAFCCYVLGHLFCSMPKEPEEPPCSVNHKRPFTTAGSVAQMSHQVWHSASSGQHSPPPAYAPQYDHPFPIQPNQSSGPLAAADRPQYKTYYGMLYGPGHSTEPDHLLTMVGQTLESCLANDSQSWKLLARELGYSQQEIGEFEVRSAVIGSNQPLVDSIKATRLLLSDWCSTVPVGAASGSTRPRPSLATLTSALQRIGRMDCVRLIHHGSRCSVAPSFHSTPLRH